MKFNFLLMRSETKVVRLEVEAENADEAYQIACQKLDDEDDPVDWDSGEIGHVEETAEFD